MNKLSKKPMYKNLVIKGLLAEIFALLKKQELLFLKQPLSLLLLCNINPYQIDSSGCQFLCPYASVSKLCN